VAEGGATNRIDSRCPKSIPVSTLPHPASSSSGRSPSPAPARSRPRRDGRLANTPPVVDPGVRLFAEMFGDPVVQSARLFVLVIALVVVATLEAIALWRLMPLKTAVPYLVEANGEGVVARVVEARRYQPSANMIKSGLANWVEQLMVLDAYRTRENLRRSTALLRGKAIAEHQAFIEAERPFERLIATPDLTREAHINSVDVSSDGIAFIFATTTERAGSQAPLLRRWRFTVHYTLVVPQDDVEIISNPVGINISHFERALDNS
jgi:type IV secretory pathway component VirB8